MFISAFDFPYDADGSETLEEEQEFPVFETTVMLGELASSISRAGRAVLDDLGEAQYDDQWAEFRFPLALLRTLESLALRENAG